MDKNNKNLIYLETYRGVDIYQSKDTETFGFNLDGNHKCSELSDTKKLIDTIFNFTQEDYKHLLSKLDDKEKEFVTTIVEALDEHINTSWCDLGVDIPYYINNFQN